jgi:proton glutamate symport protein
MIKKLSLTSWIFIGMAVGVAVGIFFPDVAKAEWVPAVANVFLRLIKSIIAPLIFGSLVYGIAGTGSVKTMGRIGLKAIIYFEVLTTIALFLGLGAVNLPKPTFLKPRRASAAPWSIPSLPASLTPWRRATCYRS